MTRGSGEPARTHTEHDEAEPDFAEEHDAVTADDEADGETESPNGLGGMDPDSGTAV